MLEPLGITSHPSVARRPWLRLALLGALLGGDLACGEGRRARTGQALARVDDELLHASVVEHVAARDAVDAEEARQRAADVLRLVAAARDARPEQPGGNDLDALASPHRVRHLERAARARLWLETDFEPKHRREDIPAEHPLLARARASRKHIHPTVHAICQVIAMPPEALDPAQREATAADPDWRRRARTVLEPVAQRLRRYLPEDDAEPCKQVQRWIRLESSPDDEVRFRVESGGFDLQACAERADDGSCETPRFSSAWTEPVSRAEGPGFLPAFFTEFGLHLVYVIEILPPRALDDPDTDDYLRREVHGAWQREAFASYVDRLREKRAIRLAPPSALRDGEHDSVSRAEP